MGNEMFYTLCKQYVREYVREHLDKSDEKIPVFDVFVVWSCKTLQAIERVAEKMNEGRMGE